MIFKLFENEKIQLKTQCVHPRYIAGVGFVGCGHCPLCLEKQKKDWITRLNCEFRTSQTGVFLTLTFDDEHLKHSSYSEITKFIRRYKHFFNLDGKHIKYFGCFEKGDLKNRSHYHLLIFGHNPKNVWPNHFLCNANLAKIWKNGIVKAQWLNINSIKYVAQYVSKKFDVKKVEFPNKLLKFFNKFSENDYELLKNTSKFCDTILEERETFIFQSKSIGFDYLFKNLKKILESSVIQFGSKKYPIPKGFLDKLRKLDNVAIIKFFDSRRFNFVSQFADLIYNFESMEDLFLIENAINDVIFQKVQNKMILYNKKMRKKNDIENARFISSCPF